MFTVNISFLGVVRSEVFSQLGMRNITICECTKMLILSTLKDWKNNRKIIQIHR